MSDFRFGKSLQLVVFEGTTVLVLSALGEVVGVERLALSGTGSRIAQKRDMANVDER